MSQCAGPQGAASHSKQGRGRATCSEHPPTTRTVIRLLLGLAVTVLLAGAAMALSRRAAASHLPSGLPLVPDKSLGVNADLSRYDTGAREQALTAMESSGLRWVRQRFAWDRIEPARGQYDWAEWDNLVAAFSRHNLRIVAVLDGTPQWARAGRDYLNPLAPPEEVADFGAFAAALARRFGDQIDHYQIWEEPNISPHWGAQEISPQAYVGLLREGAIQARSADPGAVILLAALAPNVEMGGANMSELQFLDALYQHHAAEWFDVVAGQPYDFGEPLSAPAVPSALNWARLSLLRGVMESHGDAGKPLWAVSFGLQSMDVVELSEALELVRREWPWVGPMLWAAWAADDPHGSMLSIRVRPLWLMLPASRTAARSTRCWRLGPRSRTWPGQGRIPPITPAVTTKVTGE